MKTSAIIALLKETSDFTCKQVTIARIESEHVYIQCIDKEGEPSHTFYNTALIGMVALLPSVSSYIQVTAGIPELVVYSSNMYK